MKSVNKLLHNQIVVLLVQGQYSLKKAQHLKFEERRRNKRLKLYLKNDNIWSSFMVPVPIEQTFFYVD